MDESKKLDLVKEWNAMKGDEILRVDYPLYDSSIVFDVGAYKGDWTQRILNRHKCEVYAFEAIPVMAVELFNMFHTCRNNVHVRNYGLLGHTCLQEMTYDEDHPDASSIYSNGGANFVSLFRDVVEVMDEVGGRVDLMKLNVEGAEYEILERLIAADRTSAVTNVQIQFHDFVDDSEARRERIRSVLSATHEETYCVPFVWENWRLK